MAPVRDSAHVMGRECSSLSATDLCRSDVVFGALGCDGVHDL